MVRGSGGSQGFGRVSPVTRPSPYSPLHIRGHPAAEPPGPPTLPKRLVQARRRRTLSGLAALVLVAVAAAGASFVFR